MRAAIPLVLCLGLACGRPPSDAPAQSEGEEESLGESSASSEAGNSRGTTEGSAEAESSSSGGASEGPGESEEGTDAESAGFIPGIDAGDPTPSCSPYYQDCPEGQKCVFYVAEGSYLRRESTRCIEVTGDAEPFEACELPTGFGPEITDTCGADSYCLEVYTTADHGFCAPFAGDYSCPDYPGAGYATENGSSFPDACLYFDCHPDLPEPCPADMRCVFYPAFLYGVNFCWKVPDEPDLGLGEACDYGQCGVGELCLAQEYVPGCAAERCCTQWCNIDADACSDPQAQCEHLGVWNADMPEYETLGACVVPGSLTP